MSYQQFLRRCSIIIRNGDTALEVSELRCAFQIIKALNETPNFSRVDIFNPAQSLVSHCKEGSAVIVSAGYRNGNFGMIFSGELVQKITSRSNGVDTTLSLMCEDGDAMLNKRFVVKTLAKGSTAQDVLNACAQKDEQGDISTAVKMAGSIRGKVLFGSAAACMSGVAKTNNCQLYVEDGKANIISGLDAKAAVYTLTPETGLLGDVTQTDDGISATCLLNPAIQLNAWVHIPDQYILMKAASSKSDLSKTTAKKLAETGRYRVVKLTYKGDTMGKDWSCSIDAVTQAEQKQAAGIVSGAGEDDGDQKKVAILKQWADKGSSSF